MSYFFFIERERISSAFKDSRQNNVLQPSQQEYSTNIYFVLVVVFIFALIISKGLSRYVSNPGRQQKGDGKGSKHKRQDSAGKDSTLATGSFLTQRNVSSNTKNNTFTV